MFADILIAAYAVAALVTAWLIAPSLADYIAGTEWDISRREKVQRRPSLAGKAFALCVAMVAAGMAWWLILPAALMRTPAEKAVTEKTAREAEEKWTREAERVLDEPDEPGFGNIHVIGQGGCAECSDYAGSIELAVRIGYLAGARLFSQTYASHVLSAHRKPGL